MHNLFWNCNTRTLLTLAGLYYPIFFIQLNAIKNGIDSHLAFYTVRLSLFIPFPFGVWFPCSIFSRSQFWMERVFWAASFRICLLTNWVPSTSSSLASFSRPSSYSVLSLWKMRQVWWFFPSCMDFSRGLVSGYRQASVFMILMFLDASVIGPMVASTADTDSEIGARLGVCFTFTGQPISLD